MLVATMVTSQNFNKELIKNLDTQIDKIVNGISPAIAVGIV